MLRSGLYKKNVTVALVFTKYCKIKCALCWCALAGKGFKLALRSPFCWNPCSRYKAYEDKFEVTNGAVKGALKGKEALNGINTEWDQILHTTVSARLVSRSHSGVYFPV